MAWKKVLWHYLDTIIIVDKNMDKYNYLSVLAAQVHL